MHLSVCIQDPTYAGTTYLYEAILAAAAQASDWRGLYAFASRDGVDHLIEDKIVHDFMEGGGAIDLIVGIDAVTNRGTLERMQELEHRHNNFRPKVFWNENRGLFHPKISDFGLAGGGRTLIIGSGNLTPGGLMSNFEAYTIITADQADEIDLGALEGFLERHADGIRDIDNEALERAARNIVRPISGTRQAGVRQRPAPALAPAHAAAAGFDRVMIAQVPKAGGRWGQIHFNADVIHGYFRLNNFDTERVYLTHVQPNGDREDVEVRRCVYSAGSNKNHKIEIGAAHNLDYPDDGRPVILCRERQLRTYYYMLLMPGQEGHGPLFDLSARLPSPGKGLPRPITDVATLSQAWADCPLLHLPDQDNQEL